MTPGTIPEDLERRSLWLKHALLVLLAGALVVSWYVVLFLQPGAGSGPVDVQIPDGARGLLAQVPPELVQVPGGGLGQFQNRAGTVIMILSILAALASRWLWHRDRRFATILLFCVLGVYIPRPVSPQLQFDPPRAVSAVTARQMLGHATGPLPAEARSATVETRYMLAQIAYVEGDRAAAARFAAGIDGDHLASPIEAPFRLQYLQGRPATLSTVCFLPGCVRDGARQVILAVLILLSLLALAGAGAAFRLRGALLRRRERIDTLMASIASRKRVRVPAGHK